MSVCPYAPSQTHSSLSLRPIPPTPSAKSSIAIPAFYFDIPRKIPAFYHDVPRNIPALFPNVPNNPLQTFSNILPPQIERRTPIVRRRGGNRRGRLIGGPPLKGEVLPHNSASRVNRGRLEVI
ncbi:hypothetical protein JTE90_005046 [Oedothorax gibbosus]|uniref:Uncharacterized protein n=1 Tax=Oedothorax gibbosus TaxID=931172 RepID=A0AAV6VCJ3_9ARAC|nr:hypothetical protein JTE90_005046 [Oedothorax gibbosus]